MFLNVGLYFAARFILSMQLMFFCILMQILCAVLQKSFSFCGSPSLLLCPPNNPVRSTPLNTLYGHQLVGELDSLITIKVYKNLYKDES